MTKRRSLEDALTPEQEAFLSAGNAAKETAVPNVPQETEAFSLPPPSQSEAAKPESFVNEIQIPTDGGLVSLNTRIRPQLMTALLRASMVRKYQRTEPFTQRDIVSAALEAWLKENGYA